MWTEISNIGYKFIQTGSVEFLHLRLCVMSTFVTPSALDTDRVTKLLLNFYSWMQEYVYKNYILVPYNVHVTLTHLFILRSSVFPSERARPGHYIHYRHPRTYSFRRLTQKQGLYKVLSRCKHQTCRICPIVTDNFCRFLVFPATRCQRPCFYTRVSTRDFAVLNDTFFVEQVRVP